VTLPTPLPYPVEPARNQALSGPRLTAARNDHEAVATWLAKYTDNRHTLDSYRREAERLMLWATWHGKDLPGSDGRGRAGLQGFPEPTHSRWICGASRPSRGRCLTVRRIPCVGKCGG